MGNSLFYKDYFSIKTLHKFNVNPNTILDLNKGIDNILLPFGNLSKDDKDFLQSKAIAALKDNNLYLDRECIEVAGFDDDFSLGNNIPNVNESDLILENEVKVI